MGACGSKEGAKKKEEEIQALKDAMRKQHTRSAPAKKVPPQPTGPLTDEEKQRLEEKNNITKLFKEKDRLRSRAITMFEGGISATDPSNADLIKAQQDELSKLNTTADRIQKQMRRKEAKLKAEEQQKWMVFSNVDAFDEAEIVQLTVFMRTLANKIPGMQALQEKESSRKKNVIEEYLSLQNEDQVIAAAADNKGAGKKKTAANKSNEEVKGKDLNDLTLQLSRVLGGGNNNSTSDIVAGVTAAGDRIQARRAGSVGNIDKIQARRLGSVRDIVLSTSSDKVTNVRRTPSTSSVVSAPRSHSTTEVITASKTYSMEKIVVCKTDAINISRENSRSKIVGVNIHPSARTAQASLKACPYKGEEQEPPHEMTLSEYNALEEKKKKAAEEAAAAPTSATTTTTTAGDGDDSIQAKSKLSTTSLVSNASDTASMTSAAFTEPKAVVADPLTALPDAMLQEFELPIGPITATVAQVVISVYKQGGKLSTRSVHKILRIAYRALKALPNTTKVTVGPDDKLTVVGDLHGQLADLLHILDDAGFPSATNKYVFNGDFVDRGPRGVEIVCILLALFAAFPESVVLNRGNHEDFAICCAYGFESECFHKYDDITFGMFVEIFQFLPLFAIVNDAIFIVHGGLFHSKETNLAELNAAPRNDFSLQDLPESESVVSVEKANKEEYLKQLVRDALWSDPKEEEGLASNIRGAGVAFGPDVCKAFLDANNLKMVVRSHECVLTGFDTPFEGEYQGLLCTVFSASNYGEGGNSGAYMVFTTIKPAPLDDRGSAPVVVQGSDLQYSVYYYDIDFMDEAADDDDAQTEADLSLYDLVLRKKTPLLEEFKRTDVSGKGLVTKEGWAQVMDVVMKLHIRWATMIDMLILDGCYVDAPGGKGRERLVDYNKYLDSFVVVLDVEGGDAGDLSWTEGEGTDGTVVRDYDPSLNDSADAEEIERSIEVSGSVVEALYAHHNMLGMVFKFFDRSNTGVISKKEFVEGCKLLNESLGADEKIKDSDKIANLLDVTGKGHIDINEFFEMFRIADVHSDSALTETLKTHAHLIPSLAAKNVSGLAIDGAVRRASVHHQRSTSGGDLASFVPISPDSITLPPPVTAASLAAAGKSDFILPPPLPNTGTVPDLLLPSKEDSQKGTSSSWFGLGRSPSKTNMSAKSLHGGGSASSLKNLDPMGASLHGAVLSPRDTETLRRLGPRDPLAGSIHGLGRLGPRDPLAGSIHGLGRIGSGRDPLAGSIHGLGASIHGGLGNSDQFKRVASRKDTIDQLGASMHGSMLPPGVQDERRDLLVKNFATVKSLDINELDKRSQTRMKRSQSGAFGSADEPIISGHVIHIDAPVRDSRARTVSGSGSLPRGEASPNSKAGGAK